MILEKTYYKVYDDLNKIINNLWFLVLKYSKFIFLFFTKLKLLNNIISNIT